MDFEEWLHCAGDLRLATVQGRPMPYKPVMLLAAILLVRKGQFADNLLLYPELCSAFDQVLRLLAPRSEGPDEHKLPFRHLASDRIWTLVPRVGEATDLAALLATGARAREVLRHVEGARLPEAVFVALRDSAAQSLRAIDRVVATYEHVFRAWGLEDLVGARRTLASWLAGADAEIDVRAVTSPGRTLGERQVEEAIQQAWAETPFGQRGLVLHGRQYVTPVNTIDLLALDPHQNVWWVVELKRRNSSDAVVGQLSRYRGWIAKEQGLPVERACGIILTDEVTERLRLAVTVQQGVELWRYDEGLAMERIRA